MILNRYFIAYVFKNILQEKKIKIRTKVRKYKTLIKTKSLQKPPKLISSRKKCHSLLILCCLYIKFFNRL